MQKPRVCEDIADTLNETGPYKRKFHQRYYDVVGPNDVNQNGLQSTFSLTGIEAAAAISILNTGKALATSNMLAEEIFFVSCFQNATLLDL